MLPLMLLSLLWGKAWPPGARDPVSAVLLCTIQSAAIYKGAVTAYQLYGWLGGPDGSVVGCQILIEVLMLLLYLYARTLARKAFGAAPTYEARALFMYLLLSDGARSSDSLPICFRTNNTPGQPMHPDYNHLARTMPGHQSTNTYRF